MLKRGVTSLDFFGLIFLFVFQNVLQCTSQGESTDFLAHQKENLVVIKSMHENSGVAAN